MEFVAVSVGRGEIFKLASFSPNVRAAEGKRSDRSSNGHFRLGVFGFDLAHVVAAGFFGVDICHCVKVDFFTILR